MHGERPQEHHARKSIERERVTATAAFEDQAARGALSAVLVPMACACDWLPYPHVHATDPGPVWPRRRMQTSAAGGPR
jgi:hypothetical protein